MGGKLLFKNLAIADMDSLFGLLCHPQQETT